MSVAVIGPVGASQMKLNPITDNIMKRIHQMSLEEKMQMLKEDFLDRNQTTFVKIMISVVNNPESLAFKYGS